MLSGVAALICNAMMIKRFRFMDFVWTATLVPDEVHFDSGKWPNGFRFTCTWMYLCDHDSCIFDCFNYFPLEYNFCRTQTVHRAFVRMIVFFAAQVAQNEA